MEKITELLFSQADKEYGDFQAGLTPGIPRETILGVRIPIIREISKQISEEEAYAFLSELPHRYYDENILHSVLITKIKSYDNCISAIDAFLPFVDNWAVCDIITPKSFKKREEELLFAVKRWIASEWTYACRFGIKILMNFFLDDKFKEEYLAFPASVNRDDYYVNMMIAWFFVTALAKQYDKTLPYLEQNKLSVWVHNKTIQKSVESFRITDEQKAYLKTLKRK